MSPEEAQQLDMLANTSGLTKQDYITSRLFSKEITVIPNPRIQKYFKEYLLEILEELKRLEKVREENEELMEELHYLVNVIERMGDDNEKSPYPAR